MLRSWSVGGPGGLRLSSERTLEIALHAEASGQLVNDRQAAALLGLSPGHLRNLRLAGGGAPYMKLGRAVRYSPAALAEWAASKTVTSTSQTQH